MPSRIKSLEWILPISEHDIWKDKGESSRADRVRMAVREAVAKLTVNEQDFVQLYWFEGTALDRIAKLKGSTKYRMNIFRQRIERKLKKLLMDFVEEEFGIKSSAKETCPICASRDLCRIDKLLKSKAPHETYAGYIRILNQRYHLDIKTPQIIIGHLKYHNREEV